MTYYQPRKPISGILVKIKNTSHVTISDENGYYQFQNLTTDSVCIVCQSNNYLRDSIRVDVNGNKTVDFYLDGLPRFREISLTSHKRSHWFPLIDEYFVNIETEVDDIDGISDIQSVVCLVPKLNFSDTLQPTIEKGRFGRLMTGEEMPFKSVHELLGHKIFFEVRDDFGANVVSEPEFITRIIEFTPIILEPVNYPTIAGDSVIFTWQPVQLPFSFSLNIELFQISLGVPVKADEIEGIPATNTQYVYRKPLMSGDYFWILKVVDEFGNTSSSKEGSFKKQ